MRLTSAQRALLPVAAVRSRQPQPSRVLYLFQTPAPACPRLFDHCSSGECQGGHKAASLTKCAPQHGEVRAAPPGLGRSAWVGAARTYPSPRLRPRQTCTGCVGLAGGGSRAVMQLLSLSQLRTEEGRSGGPIALHTHTPHSPELVADFPGPESRQSLCHRDRGPVQFAFVQAPHLSSRVRDLWTRHSACRVPTV